ncbi:MAG: hypothetical protein JRK53_20685 [Deltaproteobacteria bacterium]|nr:hypothetical protein [Deltaproteobacteria bacterium]
MSMIRLINVRTGVKWMGLFLMGVFFLLAGCATPPKDFDPDIKGPQMIVEPGEVSLGVAAMTGTQIVFKGKGFEPEDSVFIQLISVKKGDETVHVAVADAEVDKNGYFEAKVSTLVKVAELLNARIGSNAKMENVIVITQPPIEAKTYTARAVSMDSDKIAVCKLVVKEPSVGDNFKEKAQG